MINFNKFFLYFFPGATAASFMDRIISFIGENAFECVKTHAFLNLSKESLIKIISSDYVSNFLHRIIKNAYVFLC